MLGKDLSEALGGIGDDKILAAMKVYEKKRRRRGIIYRAAAMAAMLAILLTAALWPRRSEDGELIIAPGVVRVYAYDLSSGADVSQPVCVALEEGVEMPYEYGWHITSNIVPGLPITLSMPESEFEGAQITFEVSVNGGEFFRKLGGKYGMHRFGPAYLGQHFTVENNQTIFWWNNLTDLENWGEEYDEDRIREELEASMTGGTTGYTFPDVIPFLAGKAYADIIIRADAHIVGSVRMVIYADNMSLPIGSEEYLGCRYYAKLLSSVSFPMLNGEYQDVNREQIEEIKRG